MDSHRASSVYSTDSGKKSTYLDYQSSIGTNSRAGSFKAARDYAESLSSTPSLRATPPAPVSIPSRTNLRPSFMSYQNDKEEKKEPVAPPQPQLSVRNADPPAVSAPAANNGLLLLAVAAELHPKTMYYLGILLKKHPYSGIAIVGSKEQEVALKQLKMDIYGLIGQLQQELLVSTHFLDEWNEERISAVIQQSGGSVGTVSGVLCTPAFERALAGNTDILSLDRSELQESWAQSVGFLHAVAKSTISRILDHQQKAEGSNVFLVMAAQATSPAALLNQTTCNALLSQLREAYSGQNLHIGHAEHSLVPEPEPMKSRGAAPTSIELYTSNEPEVAPLESPTKLWNMWALQNEIGD